MPVEITAGLITSVISDLSTLGAAFWIFMLSEKYSEHTKVLDHVKMLKELFTEFNKRYDDIKDELEAIIQKFPDTDFDLEIDEHRLYHSVIMQFFNICSEEYFWYAQDRLNETIWHSRHAGIHDIYSKSKTMKTLWTEECKDKGNKSYYIKSEYEFFKKIN